jgi:FSR family fosmidomycin resistance protein-like MFS transporter
MIHTAIKLPTRPAALTGGALAAFLTAAHLATDAFTSMFSVLLPTVQARYGLSETGLALLVATLSFSTSVTQPLMGALADRIDRRLVAALGVVLSAVLIGLVGVVPTAPLLVGLLLVGGLGSAAFHPAGTSIARAAMGGNAGLAVGLFSAGGTLGIALGPVLVLAVVANSGLEATRWLLLPGLALGLITYLVVPSQPRCAGGGCPKLVDGRLIGGPVGLLALAGILASIAFITFTSAMPLWLVAERGLAHDAPLLGWTLSVFSLSAALGGIVAGVLGGRLARRTLVAGGMLLAPLPLFATFRLEPGSLPFFLAVALAGALANAGMPLLLVTAQDLAPRAVGAASGMLMGFSTGTAGLLYVGVGRLQELVGLTPAMGLSYLALIPGALVAFAVLTRYQTGTPSAAAPIGIPACGCAAVAGMPCGCAAAGTACICAETRRRRDDSAIAA